MKRFGNVIVVFVLMLVLLVNTASADAVWGVDENGKYSFKNVMVIIKNEYSQASEAVISHLLQDYDVNDIKIISEDTDDQPLILRVSLSTDNEGEFNDLINKLTQDIYVEAVFKEYYMTPDSSFLGDINRDGAITTEDARLILKYASGQMAVKTETEKFLADANRDGAITILDVKYILNYCCEI